MKRGFVTDTHEHAWEATLSYILLLLLTCMNNCFIVWLLALPSWTRPALSVVIVMELPNAANKFHQMLLE